MVHIPTEATVQEKIIQHNKDEVIKDKHNRDLSQFQIYKDREALHIVHSHYAFNNDFQFKVQKSCKKGIKLYSLTGIVSRCCMHQGMGTQTSF